MLVVAGAVVVLRFIENDAPFRYTLEVAAELQRRTTPRGASVSRPSAPRAERLSVRLEWELEADLPWDAYQKWLDREMAPDFTLLERSERTTHYSRRVGADRHLLEFRLLEHGPPLRVAVTLGTSPS